MAIWKRKETKYFTIHHSATTDGKDVDIKDIDAWHKYKGWKGCGYHVVIKRDGTIQYGRKFNEIPAAVKGHNYKIIAVCMVGDKNDFTSKQYESIENVFNMFKWMYPDIYPVLHKELTGTATECCGFNIDYFRKVNGSKPPRDTSDLK